MQQSLSGCFRCGNPGPASIVDPGLAKVRKAHPSWAERCNVAMRGPSEDGNLLESALVDKCSPCFPCEYVNNTPVAYDHHPCSTSTGKSHLRVHPHSCAGRVTFPTQSAVLDGRSSILIISYQLRSLIRHCSPFALSCPLGSHASPRLSLVCAERADGIG